MGVLEAHDVACECRRISTHDDKRSEKVSPHRNHKIFLSHPVKKKKNTGKITKFGVFW